MKNKILQQKGFTMIELLITIVILSFGIISVYEAFSSISGLAYTFSAKLQATYLAEEGLEIIRNVRDNNFIGHTTWSAGLTACSAGCQADYKTGTSSQGTANQLQAYNSSNFLKINADGFYGYDSGTNTIFTRKITITEPSGADTLRVDSQVFWSYSGKSYSAEAIEYLYNWY